MSQTSHRESGPRTAAHDKLRLASVVALDGRDEGSLVAFAARIAGGLERRLATAILDSAYERAIPVREVNQFEATPPTGVIAVVDGLRVVLGDAAVFAALGLSVTSLADWAERLRQRGEHVLFVAVEGRTAGLVGIADARE